MSDTDIPEADRAPGAPHPRESQRVIGQDVAEAEFLDAYAADRVHHAWMISGPRGIGKATLAWRIARFLLATPVDDGGMLGAPEPPKSLDIAPDNPTTKRLLALSEPRLFVLRRPWDAKTERIRTEITVDEVRKLKGFFALSSTDGGRRVVIVDAADELNVSAANALLKLLEEPPQDTVMLLIAHQPSRLLPTILSRCRQLRCQTLTPQQITEILDQSGLHIDAGSDALAALSGGSAGAALRLHTLDGLAIYQTIVDIFANPRDRQKTLALAESMTGRANVDRLDLTIELFDLFLARISRAGVTGPPSPVAAKGEAQVFSTLSKDPRAARAWAELQQVVSRRSQHARAVNLDPAALILDIVFKAHETAAKMSA